MNQKQVEGRMGEIEAAIYLKKQGYTIVCMNFKCMKGEIDIVAEKDNTLVFIEVKTRTSKKYGEPREAVDSKKQKHIYEAARYFLYKTKMDDTYTRIDVIEVYLHNRKSNSESYKTDNVKNKNLYCNIKEHKRGIKLEYLGKIDKNKIGEYRNKIVTDDIILTSERKIYIFNNHKKDCKIILRELKNVICNLDEILEDVKNKDTLFFIGKLNKHSLNIIVRLNTTNNKEHPKNSVMTAWIIRNSNLQKLRKKNKIIYKNE